jgi:hypothetical protein
MDQKKKLRATKIGGECNSPQDSDPVQDSVLAT